MLFTTIPQLRCPNCVEGIAGNLAADVRKKSGPDILFGTLLCDGCGSSFPILAGVALLVEDVESYVRQHAKGIAALANEADVPESLHDAIRQGLAEAEESSEDLESERVNALYYLTHYVRAKGTKPWWRPAKKFSPEIDRLVKNHWDNGPFTKVDQWTRRSKGLKAIELGCGAGGLARVLAPKVATYLGVDTSFTSIALARHANLGAPYTLSLEIPQDLYQGPLTKRLPLPRPLKGGKVDFVVSELENPPVPKEQFDLAVALNVIDVIRDPSDLPRLQRELLKEGGIAMQSSPYLWDREVAESLRDALPRRIKSSSEAAAYLYEQSGFSISRSAEHVPWLFLEHFRKIGLYSVHMMAAQKAPVSFSA